MRRVADRGKSHSRHPRRQSLEKIHCSARTREGARGHRRATHRWHEPCPHGAAGDEDEGVAAPPHRGCRKVAGVKQRLDDTLDPGAERAGAIVPTSAITTLRSSTSPVATVVVATRARLTPISARRGRRSDEA